MESPRGSNPEGENESHAGEALAPVVMAPSMEHGNHSSREQEERDNSKCLKEHVNSCGWFKHRMASGQPKVRGSRWAVMALSVAGGMGAKRFQMSAFESCRPLVGNRG